MRVATLLILSGVALAVLTREVPPAVAAVRGGRRMASEPGRGLKRGAVLALLALGVLRRVSRGSLGQSFVPGVERLLGVSRTPYHHGVQSAWSSRW